MRDLKKEYEIINFVYPKKNELYDYAIKILEKENKHIDDEELLKLLCFVRMILENLFLLWNIILRNQTDSNKNENNVSKFLDNLDEKHQDISLLMYI